MPKSPIKIAFALEYSLGHITHSDNLKRYLASNHSVNPVYIDIPFDGTPMPSLFKPLFKDNWSVRASAAARRGAKKAGLVDAYFFHTQVTSLFSTDLMKLAPSVVSLDATPLQYDSLGSFYKHKPGPAALESVKRWMNVRAYESAAHLVCWSQWAKDSLVSDYGITVDKITVIPPGIDAELWQVERDDSLFERAKDGLTLLFVGGDFERKGGDILLQSFRKLYALDNRHRLLIATKSLKSGELEPGVQVYNGLTPNSPELRSLYAQADVFAFPTLGDCLPLAVMEALAAGLPVICSSVGALSEAVTDGYCGYVVEPGDPNGFYDALYKFHNSPDTLRTMSKAAVFRANEKFDASKNYQQLISLLETLAK